MHQPKALEVLQNADPQLDAKLTTARKLGNRRIIGQQDIVYTTEQDITKLDEDDFDRKVGRGGGGNAQPVRRLPRDAASSNRVDDVFGRGREREPEELRRREGRDRVGRRADDWDRLDRW